MIWGKRGCLGNVKTSTFQTPLSLSKLTVTVFTLVTSIHYCKYRPDENQLYILADDCVPRWLTASHHVDFAGEDKFGNVYFVRSPQDVSEEIEEDPTGGKIKWEQGKLNGAPNKADEIVQFHVGDVVTCLQKALMIPGRTESIMSILLSVGETTWLTDLHIFRSSFRRCQWICSGNKQKTWIEHLQRF